MPPMPIDLPDAEVSLDPEWLPAAEASSLFDTLQAEVPWGVHRVRLFGRELDSPRLSCWIGDRGVAYAYSGTRHAPAPWPTALLALRDRLRGQVQVDFNGVLANLYRDGRDRMGWHSDDERELGERPTIASVSLGAPRRFLLKCRAEPSVKLALELPHGSLLLMAGQTQSRYLHALPPTARPCGARINLTFRRIIA